MLAGQLEIWRRAGPPDDFVIVEQGAHHGEFSTDVLEALHAGSAELFAMLRYRSWSRFRFYDRRPARGAASFAEDGMCASRRDGAFRVHFSNELVDAMPVHLLVRRRYPDQRAWHERLVERTSCGFTFVLGRSPMGEYEPKSRASATAAKPL